MSYQYDAFFSYKRDSESDAWHETVKNKLSYWLKHDLQRQDVRIFFDTEDIRTGMRWKQKLETALRQSRCIVCVWSPLYFQSKWCVSEWKTFVAREQGGKHTLVMPASYFDGDTFPSEASARQFPKFNNFASTMPKFWDTELAVRFEDEKIKPFAHELAKMILSAPPYDDNFPIVEVPDHEVAPQGTIGRAASNV